MPLETLPELKPISLLLPLHNCTNCRRNFNTPENNPVRIGTSKKPWNCFCSFSCASTYKKSVLFQTIGTLIQ